LSLLASKNGEQRKRNNNNKSPPLHFLTSL
jgi:hypothetical protein